jgi:hypothetical protein
MKVRVYSSLMSVDHGRSVHVQVQAKLKLVGIEAIYLATVKPLLISGQTSKLSSVAVSDYSQTSTIGSIY